MPRMYWAVRNMSAEFGRAWLLQFHLEQSLTIILRQNQCGFARGAIRFHRAIRPGNGWGAKPVPTERHCCSALATPPSVTAAVQNKSAGNRLSRGPAGWKCLRYPSPAGCRLKVGQSLTTQWRLKSIFRRPLTSAMFLCCNTGIVHRCGMNLVQLC